MLTTFELTKVAIRKGDAIYAFGGTRIFFNESSFGECDVLSDND